jgi:hypothetical protein
MVVSSTLVCEVISLDYISYLDVPYDTAEITFSTLIIVLIFRHIYSPQNFRIMKKTFITVIFNNSTNINKTSNKPTFTEQKKETNDIKCLKSRSYRDTDKKKCGWG